MSSWSLLQIMCIHLLLAYSFQHAHVSPRVPPEVDADAFSCRLEGGPPGRYPTSASYYTEYNVPPLPSSFDPQSMTYYIYIDMHMNPDGQGEDNQFVPQLMLGNVLCNSTNSDDYKPSWCILSEWHIQSQYYFQTDDTKTSHAVTGDMIAVKEGDIIYTEFLYDSTDYVWTLNIGVSKGSNANAVSTVIATQPYMGLLSENTTSWNEPAYQTAHIGCQWELYGMQQQENYPSNMNYTVTVGSNDGPADWWQVWQANATADCKYQPMLYQDSYVNPQETQQVGHFDLYYAAD
mmetsp:Transcript_33741/g.53992  ORF Transcript_33741/g.53992 Transcript_33741/m.53992 type:complete len:291 (+) Transcript_33741:21-893(+)